MKNKYLAVVLVFMLVALLPYAALAIGSLEIDGSTYTAADLAGDLADTGWAWLASANEGQGELMLNGYNGGAIAATDGVLYIQLIGENILTADAPAVLAVSGENTGLQIYGSDSASDSLTIYSTLSDTSTYQAWGITVTISNSATIPFSLKDMSLTIDMSMVQGLEIVPGVFNYRSTGGIIVLQTVRNAAIVGIDMAMDNTVITASGGGEHTYFYYGMWANPYYSSIEAEFNNCTFNISDFRVRGWYTGRDYAYSSSAAYNNCFFNIHSTASGTIGLHVSSDNEAGYGTSTLTLNYPDGEVETGGTAVYARSANPTLVINGATIQAWQKDGTEIADPQIVSIFTNNTYTAYAARSVGLMDTFYSSADYDTIAARVLFTRLPYPATGDSSVPVGYGLILLLSAAGLAWVSKTALHKH